MEFTFWDEQWRSHTERTGEQGGETPCSTDPPQNDHTGKKG